MIDIVTADHIISLVMAVAAAFGVYMGIRLDLQAAHSKSEAAKVAADEAKEDAKAANELAGDAHQKLYQHVTELHASHGK